MAARLQRRAHDLDRLFVIVRDKNACHGMTLAGER